MLSRWARMLPRHPEQRGGIHEADCELVPFGDGRLLAATIDSIDEEIETHLYESPITSGRIAAAASLSDLAAVGADPIGLLLSVCLPRGAVDDTQALVASGVASACAASNTFVLGGDTSEGAALRVSCVGLGSVPAGGAIRRVGLRPGDRLFASGLLGAGAALAAAKLLRLSGIGITEEDFAPPSRIAHGRALRRIASACIDTSDGLFAAVDQLARLNDVAIHLDANLAGFLEPSAARVRRVIGLGGGFPLLASMHGEFELVFGVPPDRLHDLEHVARVLAWQPVPLGQVRDGQGLRVGDVPVDGARVRNLHRECGGEIERYVTALVLLAREIEREAARHSPV